jgi:hypothetical protein
MNRRRFFWLGASAVGLATVAVFVSSRLSSAPVQPFRAAHLNAEHHELLDGLIRGFLGPVLPTDAPQRQQALSVCKDRVLAGIGGLAPLAQAEIGELLDLLSHPVGRRLLGGPASGWQNATQAELSGFLNGLRFHSLTLLRPAYAGLHNIVYGAWYSNESSWGDIGYTRPFNLV